MTPWHWTSNLVPLAPFIMIIFVVWFGMNAKRAQNKNRTELQKEMLSKFSSAQELADFMKTDAGKLFMPEPERKHTPARRAGLGIFILVVGIGLYLSSMATHDEHNAGGAAMGGFIVIAAGIGMLLSAFISRKLAAKWESDNEK